MKYQKGFTSLELAFAVFCIVGAFGWGWNIDKLVDIGFNAPLTVETVLRMVGIIVVPLGVVMGFI